MTGSDRLTGAEIGLVERYVSVLDLVWRCAQAVERGDWSALCEQTTWLEAAASRLAETAGTASAAWHADRSVVRVALVRAAVTLQGRRCHAVRAVHPGDLDQVGEDVRRAWAAYQAAQDVQAVAHDHDARCRAVNWLPDLAADVEQLAAELRAARPELARRAVDLAGVQLEAAGLRQALALLTGCGHEPDGGLDCPGCDPVPPMVRRALEGTAGRALAEELHAAREVVELARRHADRHAPFPLPGLADAVAAYDRAAGATPQGGEGR